jgi:hypothetical protein
MAEERVLYLSPEEIQVSINERRNVGVLFPYPGIHLALELTPMEARRLADTLRKKADEAEAGVPRG